MGDRTYARIAIGGRLDPSKVQLLAEALASEGVYATARDGGEHVDVDRAREELEWCATANEAAVFADDQVNYGQFTNIELLCRQLRLDFKRVNDTGDGYSAGIYRFIPGSKADGSEDYVTADVATDDDRDPVVTLTDLRRVNSIEELRALCAPLERADSEPGPLVIGGPLTALVKEAERARAKDDKVG